MSRQALAQARHPMHHAVLFWRINCGTWTVTGRHRTAADGFPTIRCSEAATHHGEEGERTAPPHWHTGRSVYLAATYRRVILQTTPGESLLFLFNDLNSHKKKATFEEISLFFLDNLHEEDEFIQSLYGRAIREVSTVPQVLWCLLPPPTLTKEAISAVYNAKGGHDVPPSFPHRPLMAKLSSEARETADY